MVEALISYLDTNIVIFLHANTPRLTARAIEQIESTNLLISPVVQLELEMLYEKGKLRYSATQILADLNQQIGLSVCQLTFASVVARAASLSWIRDPAARLIVGNALANNEAPLITSDRTIHENYANAVW